MPIERIGESNDWSEFGFHDVTVEVPDCYMPILWKKTPKLIFPTGIFRGVYFSEEIKLAVSQGARVLKHHRGEMFDSRTDFFEEYIKKLFKCALIMKRAHRSIFWARI